MASLDDFISKNNVPLQDDAILTGDSGSLKLEVALVSVSTQFLKFSHMGTDYVVDRAAVLDVAERKDTSVGDSAATLTLSKDTKLLASYSINASDISSAMPFSLSRVSAAPSRRAIISQKEVAWRKATSYDQPSARYPSLEIYLSPYSSATVCDSHSAGILDDSLADDEQADY